MVQLVGFAGSLRKASINKALLQAASGLMSAGDQLKVLAIDDVPLYNGDIEAESGIPTSVVSLKAVIERADGLVIATPEYNSGIPGVAKNVIDWISRPADDIARVLHGKPVALIGASGGRFGTASAQAAWLPVLRTLRMKVWVGGGSFFVPQAFKSFGPEGSIDEELKQRLTAYLAGFVQSI